MYVSRALQEHTSDFSLLNVRQTKLQQPLASIDVILSVHYQHRLNRANRVRLTSLDMRTTKIPFLTSVFIPCFFANFINTSSDAAP